MRSITVWYDYDGDDAAWRAVIDPFIAAINSDENIAGKFTYQVSRATDGNTRVHWGRWDSADTLSAMQATDYFKSFASALQSLIGGPPNTMVADVTTKTDGW